MDKNSIQKVLDEIKLQPKRKFIQSYDFIINLANIQTKQNPLDFYVTMHFPKGNKVKVAAFVDQELAEQSKKFCDLTIREVDFQTYSDKKSVKKLANEYDYFIAQAGDGSLVWLYRSRLPAAPGEVSWFLQGRFG